MRRQLVAAVLAGFLALVSVGVVPTSAEAANRWSELWRCVNSDGAGYAQGTFDYVTNQGDCSIYGPERLVCFMKNGDQGVGVFGDTNDDGIWSYLDERGRCVRA